MTQNSVETLELPTAFRAQSAQRPQRNVARIITVEPSKRVASPELTFDVIHHRSDFDRLEDDWCALFDRCGTGHQVFQTFHWLWHWCNAFLSDDDYKSALAIVTGRKAGKLVLAWPLIVYRSGGLAKLNWMGQPVSQYGDILFDDKACSFTDLEKSWTYILTNVKADVACLRKVRADAAVAPLFQNIDCKAIALDKAPYLDLSNAKNYEDFEKQFSTKSRRNRRRLRRRLEERSTIAVENHHANNIKDALVRDAISLKKRWLKSRGLFSAALRDHRTEKFFENATTSTEHPTGCQTTTFGVDNVNAAIAVSFTVKKHQAVHIIVYDVDHEKSGVGVLMIEETIRAAIEQGTETFDFMAPGDKYKFDWADRSVDVTDWSCALSRLGRIAMRLKLPEIPQVVKKTTQALPLGVRQFLYHRMLGQRH